MQPKALICQQDIGTQSAGSVLAALWAETSCLWFSEWKHVLKQTSSCVNEDFQQVPETWTQEVPLTYTQSPAGQPK